MTRRQLQPYKSELRTVFNRMCALVEKRTLELAAMRRQRDDARIAAIGFLLLSLVLVAVGIGLALA